MRIAALNVGHQAIRPKMVDVELLDALLAVEADLLFLVEFVQTPEYLTALSARWPYLRLTEQVQYGPSKSRFANQVVALSIWPMEVGEGLPPVPDVHASTNFMSVHICGWTITGLRAPAYELSDEWYRYWDGLRARLDGHVVIGDFNVDPSRHAKKDRVLPGVGWRLVTPSGVSYRSLTNGSESAIDHALVRPELSVVSCEYLGSFFDTGRLDHCPINLTLDGTAPEQRGS